MSKGYGDLQRAIIEVLAPYSDTPHEMLPHVAKIACDVYGIDDNHSPTVAQYNAVTRALRSLQRQGIVKYAWYPKRARLARPEDNEPILTIKRGIAVTSS